MGFVGKAVVILMVLMSVWSLWVMVERFIVFQQGEEPVAQAARRALEPAHQGRYSAGHRGHQEVQGSHLAKVIAAGLLEFEASRRDKRTTDPELAVEAARQGMDRTAMITVAELKENLGVLATIGATAPFVGLFGTVIGIISAFAGMAKSGGGIAAVSAGIAEALAHHGRRPARGHSRGLGVQLLPEPRRALHRRDVQLGLGDGRSTS